MHTVALKGTWQRNFYPGFFSSLLGPLLFHFFEYFEPFPKFGFHARVTREKFLPLLIVGRKWLMNSRTVTDGGALPVRQARVWISARHPQKIPPSEPAAVKILYIWRKASANVIYEWLYEYEWTKTTCPVPRIDYLCYQQVKGQCHKIFRFRFFFINHLLSSPWK